MKPALAASNEFKIEKGVPLPSVISGRRVKFPFASMEVGDSIVIPITSTSAAHNWGKDHNAKFTCRKESDTTARVWRIA